MRSLRDSDSETLRAAASASGRRLVEVDLTACRDRASALQAIGNAFGFPRWYGANLDALYDALTDLGQAGGTGFVVLLNGVPQASPGFSEQQQRELLKVFRDVVSHYRSSGLPFSVYYRA